MKWFIGSLIWALCIIQYERVNMKEYKQSGFKVSINFINSIPLYNIYQCLETESWPQRLGVVILQSYLFFPAEKQWAQLFLDLEMTPVILMKMETCYQYLVYLKILFF